MLPPVQREVNEWNSHGLRGIVSSFAPPPRKYKIKIGKRVQTGSTIKRKSHYYLYSKQESFKLYRKIKENLSIRHEKCDCVKQRFSVNLGYFVEGYT